MGSPDANSGHSSFWEALSALEKLENVGPKQLPPHISAASRHQASLR